MLLIIILFQLESFFMSKSMILLFILSTHVISEASDVTGFLAFMGYCFIASKMCTPTSVEDLKFVLLRDKYRHLSKLVDQQKKEELEQYIIEKASNSETAFKEFLATLQTDYLAVEGKLNVAQKKYSNYKKEKISSASIEIKKYQEILSQIKAVEVYFYKNIYDKSSISHADTHKTSTVPA